MKRFSTKALCRAGVVAALYVALVYAMSGLATGAIQFRPSEALTLLPLLFPETIPALAIGCVLGNLTSPFGVWDIVLGSCVTLAAAILTYAIGRLFKNKWLKVIVGGLPPVLLNALILPLIWRLFGPLEYVYWLQALYLLISQSIAVYLIGIPLYFAIARLKDRGLSVFDNAPMRRKHPRLPSENETADADRHIAADAENEKSNDAGQDDRDDADDDRF